LAGPYVLTGSGLQLIAQPRGLKVEVLAVGQRLAAGGANPRNLYDVGLLRWGNADGYFPPVPVDADTQQLALPRGMTTLGYKLGPGAQIRVTETAGLAVPIYDRHPVDFQQSAFLTVNGGQNPLAWDYTVPAGKLLELANLSAQISRTGAASGVGGIYANVQRNGGYILSAVMTGGTQGAYVADRLGGAPLYLVAGETLHAFVFDSDVGGQVFVNIVASGTLFDP
jgi:hypothetical protein